MRYERKRKKIRKSIKTYIFFIFLTATFGPHPRTLVPYSEHQKLSEFHVVESNVENPFCLYSEFFQDMYVIPKKKLILASLACIQYVGICLA